MLIEEAFEGIGETSSSLRCSARAQKVRLMHLVLTQHIEYLDTGVIPHKIVHKALESAQQRLMNFIFKTNLD